MSKFIKKQQAKTLNIMFGVRPRLGTCAFYKLITLKLKWLHTNKKDLKNFDWKGSPIYIRFMQANGIDKPIIAKKII